jgi:hypothetical protein
MSDATTATFETHDGLTISSTSQTEEQLKEAFKAPEKPEPEPQADGDGGEEGESQDGKEGKNKWSRHSATERVKQATREAKDARERLAAAEAKAQRLDEIERRAVAAEAELARLRGAAVPEKAEAKPEPKSDDQEPKEDDFEDYGAYVKAQARWEARQEFKSQTEKSREESKREGMIQHQVKMFETFQERIKAAITADPTLDQKIKPELIAMLPQGPVDLSKRLTNDQLIGLHFIREERGLDIMAYLSDNPDVLQRLSTLDHGSLMVELGRIEGRLGAAPSTATARPGISRANPPVRPVTAVAPSGDADELDPKDDFEVYAKKRMRQLEREAKAAR